MSFLLIIGFVSFGWLAKKYHWLSDRGISLTNRYVIWVCLPAIALLKIPSLQIDGALLFPMLMTWMLLPVISLLIYFLSKRYQWDRQVTGCLLLVSCFGNSSFVGFPIIQAFLGAEALAYAVVYDQIGSFLSLAIVGNIFIAHYSSVDNPEGNNQLSSRLVMFKVATFPPFVALVLALLLDGIYLNDFSIELLSIIAMTLLPATMILVGAHFKFQLESHLRKPLIWGLASKMIIAPVLAWGILSLANQNQLAAQVTLMEAAMPPMVTASILAINAKLAPQLASAAVGYGLVLAILIMPLVSWISTTL